VRRVRCCGRPSERPRRERRLQRELKELLAWARRTTDGSLSDLAVPPRRAVWDQVVSENDNCLRARCPYYSTCFFYEARRAAARADIIIANHHLLMADLALREEIGSDTQNAVLPPARRIIIDEAHHLEDVATNYFGSHLSYAAIERAFTHLRSTKHEAKGLLPALIMALESIEAPDDAAVAAGAVRWIEHRLLPRRMSLLVDAEQCFMELRTGLEELLGDRLTPGVDQKIRVVPEVRALPYWHTLEKWLAQLGTALGDFAGDFDGVCDGIDQLSEGVEKQVLFLNTELRAIQSRIAARTERCGGP
jgi:ATP-dependent DNA helicase DinG